MSATLKWNGDEALAAVQRTVAQRMIAAALTLQAAHKQALNASNPPPHDNPAPVGAYPRKRTGYLQSHVLVAPLNVDAVAQSGRVTVGYETSAFYGDVLASRGWLGIGDTAGRILTQLAAVVGEGVNVQVGAK